MALRLTTLGGCRLEDEAGQAIAAPYLSLILLAYLYRAERPVARRDMALLLWPGNKESATTNLRSALLRLAKAEAPRTSCVVSNGNSLSLNYGALSCDLEFEAMAVGEDNLELISDAVAHPFLPSAGSGVTALDLWVRDVRQHHLSLLRKLFLATDASAANGPSRSSLRRAAVLLLEHDPADEEIRSRISGDRARPTKVPASVTLPSLFADTQTPVSPLPTTGVSIWTAPRIALLPPETSLTAQKSGSIANALIEDLTIGLCSERAVSVVAPYTSERIRASRDKASILERHKITYVLDSQRTDDSLFVQLIFLPTDEVVWADRFRLDPMQIVQQRSVITQAVQTSLIDRMSSGSQMALDYSKRPGAYVSYLRGLQDLATMALPSMRRARKHFREALDQDRGFASALAGLSRTYSMEWILTARGDSELLLEAMRLADQAVTENNASAGAFKELGVSQLFIGQIDESLEALATAEELSPHYADVLFSHADSLVHANRPAEALAKIENSIYLNPLPPDPYFWAAAGASYFLGRYRQALDYIERMRDSRPADRLAAASWAMLGDSTKARTFRLRVLKENPSFDVERWLSVLPLREQWQLDIYREGLLKAGF